jgi:hypothetical protein
MGKGLSLKNALTFAAIAIGVLATTSALSAAGAAEPQSKAKHYKATRAFVVDKVNGAVRMPTQQEVDEVVANLTALAQKPEDSLTQTTQSSGAVSVDLDGGFAGIILARPAADGSMETRCVFTLEEGIAFLGIVEDESVKG